MKINFNYNKAISDANQLNELSKELELLCKTKIDTVINNLDSSWKGESASLMIGKCIDEKEKILNYAVELKRLASNLRSSANEIKRAEEEAIELQRQLDAATKKGFSSAEGYGGGFSNGSGSGGGGGGGGF